MYNIIQIDRELERLSPELGGVFSRPDLEVLFKSMGYSGQRLINLLTKLTNMEVLFRFCRGFYVRKDFDLRLLSQKIDPESYISCGNILGDKCIVGPIQKFGITAVSTAPRPRYYRTSLGNIRFLTIKEKYTKFGVITENGLRVANAEKAFIDTCYYYKKGMRFNFNIYCDMGVDFLDLDLVLEYLGNYSNPNFTGFVRTVINENRKI